MHSRGVSACVPHLHTSDKMGSADTDTINYKEGMGGMDIIFAGGGTAACIAAGRLAKANPDLKILLIEGGPNQFEVSSLPLTDWLR